MMRDIGYDNSLLRQIPELIVPLRQVNKVIKKDPTAKENATSGLNVTVSRILYLK